MSFGHSQKDVLGKIRILVSLGYRIEDCRDENVLMVHTFLSFNLIEIVSVLLSVFEERLNPKRERSQTITKSKALKCYKFPFYLVFIADFKQSSYIGFNKPNDICNNYLKRYNWNDKNCQVRLLVRLLFKLREYFVNG